MSFLEHYLHLLAPPNDTQPNVVAPTTISKQWAIGVNYWLDWRTVRKGSYQHLDVGGGQDEADGPEGHRGTVPEGGTVFVHWAMGF